MAYIISSGDHIPQLFMNVYQVQLDKKMTVCIGIGPLVTSPYKVCKYAVLF